MNNQKSRTHFAVLNISTNILGFIFNTILGFVARIIFVKYLTVDYLGLNGLFSNIIMMLSLTELGIGGVITYALYEPLAKNDRPKIIALVSFFSKTYKIIGIVIALLGISIIPFFKIIFQDPPKVQENIIYIYLLFLFSASFSYFFSYKLALLRASQKDYLVVGTNYIVSIAQNILQIVFLIITKDYMIYLYIQVAAGVIYYLWISFIVKKQYAYLNTKIDVKLEKNEKRAIFKNIWALSVSRFSGLLVNSTDNIIITYLINVAAVGLLSNYLLLTKTLDGIINNLLISTTGGIGNFNALEERNKTRILFSNMQFLMFFIYGWVTLAIVLLSNDIVELLFGKDYVMSNKISLIIALNFYMVGLQSVLWTFRNAMGLFNYRKYLLLVTAIINLILSFYLGAKFGVFGVLIATAIARLLTNWWYDPIVVFKYGFNVLVRDYYFKYFRYLLILLVSIGLSYLVGNYIRISLVYNILIKGLLGSIIFFIIVYILFRNSEELKYTIQKAIQIRTVLLGFIKPTPTTY